MGWKMKKSLGECELDRDQLLRSLAGGCEVIEASSDPQSGHGRFQGLIQNRQLRIELAHPISDVPKATASDWVLTYLGKAKGQNPPPFARLTAEWRPFSIRDTPPKGDAATTLRELAFLDRDRRQGVSNSAACSPGRPPCPRPSSAWPSSGES